MTFTKVHERRLRALAKKLRSLSKREQKHFDMTRWFAHDSHYGHLHPLSKPKARGRSVVQVTRAHLMHCGTAGCAIGWAASMPMFQKLGLRMHWDWDMEDGYPVLQTSKNKHLSGAMRVVQRLFGLTREAAGWLTSEHDPDERPTEVADRIDRLIEAKGGRRAWRQ